jgi:hypothetical protein
VVENPKLRITARRRGRSVRDRGDRPVRFREAHPLNEPLQLGLCELRQLVEISELSFRRGFGFVKPVAPIGLPMDAQRRSNGVAELSVSKAVLAREDFYPFIQASTFDGNAEPECQVIDVYAAFGCQQGLGTEDPKMASPARLFERGIHSVLLEFPLQLEQGLQGSVEICVDRNPL